MRNIHIKEVRPPPQADDDVVWNSLPKVALDLEDIFVHYEERKKVIKNKLLVKHNKHYEEKKKVIKTKMISYHYNAHSREWQN